ncbi:MAG: hypothetical protein R3185_03625, partial [Candidatus Thermoplasmatota archaeon]|nr:hypothetical protein [Candidatus Thermoplasmatota archaeon]
MRVRRARRVAWACARGRAASLAPPGACGARRDVDPDHGAGGARAAHWNAALGVDRGALEIADRAQHLTDGGADPRRGSGSHMEFKDYYSTLGVGR